MKIDRSFIAPLGRTRESLAIIDLCTNLDIDTTAEGVETESQLAVLSKLGCTEAQGYSFSKPRPASDIAELFDRFESASCPKVHLRHLDSQP